MKRIAGIVMLLLMIFCVGMACAEGQLVFWKDGKGLRTKPTDGAEKLCLIPAYTVVEMEPWNNNWAQVTYEGQTGYVFSSGWTTVPVATACDPWQAYVEEDTLLLRLPTEKSTQSVPVSAWSYVTVLGEYKDYYYASADGNEGFIGKTLCHSAEYTIGQIETVTFRVEESAALYQEPLPNAQTAGELAAGTEWTTTTQSSNGWYYVETENGSGYVQPDKATVYIQRYWKETKYIRQDPNENAKVLASIPMNTIVDTAEVNNRWTKVSVDGMIGYVRTAGIAEVP